MGMLLVDRRRAALRAAAAPFVTLVLCVTVSVTAEFLQMFAPGRVPSTLDVLAHTIGTLLGTAMWAVIGRDLTNWLRATIASKEEGRLMRLLTAYAAAWVFVSLAPFDITIDLGDLAQAFRSGRIVLVPFAGGGGVARGGWDALAATLSAIPLGLFGRAGYHRQARRALAAFAWGAAFIVLVEIAQVFIRSHAADVNDVLFGLLGVAVGVLVGDRVLSTRLEPQLPSSVAVSGWALIALAGWCLVLFAYHWLPYDFVVDAEGIRQKLERVSIVPFSGYRGSDLNAFNDLLVKLGLAIPFGLVATFVARGTAWPRLLLLAWLALAAAVFGTVEVGQFFLPTRVPDPTDVLIGVAGTYAGLVLGRWLHGHTPFARR
jgi:VanZ family protein